MTVLARSDSAHADANAARVPSRLLVATLGERPVMSVARLAAALAQRDESKVLVVAAITPVPYDSALPGPESRAAVYAESVCEVVQKVRAKLHHVAGADAWPVDPVVGWPEDAIHDTAEAWHASLILMGARHHGIFARLAGRETAIGIVRKAPVPVLAVHEGARHLPKRLLAATAFDEPSTTAALAACELLQSNGSVTLAHASALIGSDFHGDLAELTRAGIKARLTEAAASLARVSGRPVDVAPLGGEPGKALIAHARRGRYDLISLGGPVSGWFERLLLGSIRTYVLRRAPCSVLIAPALPQEA